MTMDDMFVPRHVPVQPPPATPTEDFETPEEIASKPEPATAPEPAVPDEHITLPGPEPGKPRLNHRLLNRWRHLSTKRKILLATGSALIAIGLAGGLVLALTGQPAKAPVVSIVKPKAKPAPKPTTVASMLTGLQVDPSVNQRPVTGVMIENSDGARPQSGLDQAGVVFEAVAEAGITRFLALYQDTQPAYIGPVRSVRPYYLQWCLSFDCAIAHVGGSPDALSDIGPWNVKNLDEFYNGSYYQRISSRYAPHNVYTSMTQLNQLEASKGFGAAKFTGFARKVDAPAKTVTAASIDMSPSSADFAVHYDYNAATNNYTRSEAGAPHVELDAAGNQTPITPKVVIAMIVQQSQGALDSSGAYYTDYAAIGSGAVDVFQDGTLITGTWSKASNDAPLVLTNAAGKPLALNAGQTWFTILGSASYVSYKP